MLLGTLGASLMGKILAGKGVKTKSVSKETNSKSQGRGINRVGKDQEINRSGYGSRSSKMDF